MKVLVTGANGFIGKELTRSLYDQGYHVVEASRKTKKKPESSLKEM